MSEEPGDNGVVYVASASGKDVQYRVRLQGEIPSCSCFDWKKTGFPCKHIAAAVEHTGVDWAALPETFTKHPMFSPDIAVCVETPTSVPVAPANVAIEEQEAMEVKIHDPISDSSTQPEASKNDAIQTSQLLQKIENEDARRRRILALEKAQGVWKDILRLLCLNDSADIADGALDQLKATQEFLENAVQDGKRLKELLREDLARQPIKKSSVSAKAAKARGQYRKYAARQRAFEALRGSTVRSSSGVRKRVIPMDDRGAKKLRRRVAQLRKKAMAAEKRADKAAAERARPRILQLDDTKYAYNPLAVPVIELDPELRDEPCTFVSGKEFRRLGNSSSRGVCKFNFVFIETVLKISSFVHLSAAQSSACYAFRRQHGPR